MGTGKGRGGERERGRHEEIAYWIGTRVRGGSEPHLRALQYRPHARPPPHTWATLRRKIAGRRSASVASASASVPAGIRARR